MMYDVKEVAQNVRHEGLQEHYRVPRVRNTRLHTYKNPIMMYDV